ncbi:hypothetical protein BV898_05177 [Hypsibius exemplaris]|uniref:Uncharacterized protein n=1 Tax=Hypsibius exemplaris TaxID=2072580 RepID=A0A1W0X056_HYPEX|nr:hypothetical protein BV898_05177 [Hypsibius exemplaris]
MAFLFQLFFGICSFVWMVLTQELVPADEAGFPSRAQNRDFSITSSGRRTPSSSWQNSRLTTRSNAKRSLYPDYFRVEVEIVRLENPQGLLVTGKHCDFFNDCDPRVIAYLDISKPRSPWPGNHPASRWPIVFEGTNANSPKIGKIINQDICGGSLSAVNARVRVTEADDLSGHDDIGDFECLFDVDPRDIQQPDLARWGSEKSCEAVNIRGTSKLFARMRTFEIPSTSCRAG